MSLVESVRFEPTGITSYVDPCPRFLDLVGLGGIISSLGIVLRKEKKQVRFFRRRGLKSLIV